MAFIETFSSQVFGKILANLRESTRNGVCVPNTLTDEEYEWFRELNNEMQTLMTLAFARDPTATEAYDVAQAKREVGHGVDKFLTVIGR